MLDPADRLLLIEYEAARPIAGRGPGDRRFWYAPGGGVDPGETLAEAAARELMGEIGVRDAPIGPLVARWRGPLTLFRRPTFTDAAFFLVRLPNDAIDTSDLALTEGDPVTDVRWFTPDELAAAAERIAPQGLPALLARILRGDIPREPVALSSPLW